MTDAMPAIKIPWTNEYEALQCPACGSDYLHHMQVDIFERSEDAVDGLHLSVTRSSVLTNTELTGNPSSRRNGLTIEFWCENCDRRSVLSIAQHKGQSHVGWQFKADA